MARHFSEREGFWSRMKASAAGVVLWPFSTAQHRHRAWKITKPLLALLFFCWIGYMIYAFTIFWGQNILYPQQILADERLIEAPTPLDANSEIQSPSEACLPSQTVEIMVHLIDLNVNQNVWVPSHPVYKFGIFGLVSWEQTPFFDNKMSEQIGMLDILRRIGIELTDSLGRVRGTSEENENLSSAHSLLRINARAWYFNPFDLNVNTVSPSAADSYRDAIPLYQAYNRDVAACDAVFDTRADNLRELLSRLTATLGATTAELGSRTRAWTYDPETDQFVEGDGNNWAWFDFRADNFLHRARGKMYALHGFMQAIRADFSEVLEQRNADEIYDRMERSIAEAASMEPPIVSNGGQDSIIFPDHLGKMAELIFRARTAMVELRDILRE